MAAADYTCPFSARLYRRLRTEILPAYGEKLRFTFKHQVQPWHPQSALLHTSALAARALAGDDGFWRMSDALFDRLEEFKNEPLQELGMRQIVDRLVGVAVEAVGGDETKWAHAMQMGPEDGWDSPQTKALKAAIKESRKHCIHVSPTVVINGKVHEGTSSAWTLEEWRSFLAQFL